MSAQILRYQSGQPIDTTLPLEIGTLDAKEWRLIEEAYPEIRTADSKAAFRRAPVVVMFPPGYVSPKHLQTILKAGNETRIVYPHPTKEAPTSVLVHLIGGYASLHIYRLEPGRKR